MNIQWTMLREPTATDLTGIRTFTCMSTHVNSQGASIAETFSTRQADVSYITGMQLKMFPIFLKMYESTPANSTTVWCCYLFLRHGDTRPYTIMSLKLLCRCKLLLADSTWEGLTIDCACHSEYAVHFWQYSNNINCRHLYHPLHSILPLQSSYHIIHILHSHNEPLLFHNYYSSRSTWQSCCHLSVYERPLDSIFTGTASVGQIHLTVSFVS